MDNNNLVKLDKNTLIISLITLVLLFIVYYNGFYYLTGYFLARSDLGDFQFHLSRIEDPFCESCYYYAPLFHIIILLLNGIFQESIISLSLFLPLLFFLLLPYSFYRLSKIYWNNEKIGISSAFISLFGNIVVLVFITDAIYPQALNLFFLVMGLGSMIIDLRRPNQEISRSPFLWGILAILSHSMGALLYAIALVLWLILRRSRLVIPIILLGAFSFYFYFPDNYRWILWQLTSVKQSLEIFLLWFNPLTLYLALKGYNSDRKDKETCLLEVIIIITLASSFLDPAFRSLLFTSAVLSVFSGKGLFFHKRRGVISTILLGLWLLVLFYCTIGIYGLYIL